MIKIKKYYCKNCKVNKICKRTALYGNQRCRRCANLGKLNPQYGKRRGGKDNPNWKGGKPFCLNCGKQLMNYDSKLCIICFPKSRKNKPRGGKLRIGKNAPSYKHGKSITPNYCKKCKKEISWTAQRCYDCWSKINMGENNSSYIHGEGNKPYPLTFSKILKRKIKIRDNYKCQVCGIIETKHKEKYHQLLHIHHIDYDKQNCDDNNLITTCRCCNLRANFNRDYWYAYFTYIMENKDK